MKRESRSRLYAIALAGLGALLATAPALAGSPSDDKVDVTSETQGVSFGHAVQISVPDYYGIEPKLAVTYNANGPVGLAGPGWNLAGFSVIEKRGRSHGVPQYAATDRLFLDGQELIPCSSATGSPGCAAGGTHATKLESFSKIVRTGDNFTVCKDGICTAYAPIICTPRGIYRWGVTSVSDNLGHSTLYTWDTTSSCNGSAGPGTGTPAYAYPKSVSYNGTKFGISFFYENSAQRFATATGEDDIVLTKRLRSVDVKVLGARQSAVGLFYQAGTDVLTKIQPYGTDAVLDTAGAITSGSTALPAQTFVMSAPTLGFATAAVASGISCPPDASLSPVDLNGDGFTDFVCIDAKTGSGDTNNRILIYLNNRAGGYAAATSLPYPNTKKVPTFVDINCDRRPDLVWISTTCPQQWRGLLNNGAGAFGTTDVAVGNLPTDVDLLYPAQFTDINGDSCTDIVYPSTLSGPAYRSYKVLYGKQVESNLCLDPEQFLLNHPAEAAQESITLPLPLRFTDIDGNGAADVLYFKNTTTTTSAELKAILGTGYAMDGATVSLGVMSEFDGLSNLTFAQLATGRGSDLVYLKAGTRSIMVRPWNNATQTFAAPTVVGSAPTGIPIVSLMTGDFNGDGRQDIVAVANGGGGNVTPYVYLNQSAEARLAEVRNGLGGYRRLTYANAAAMPNTFDVPPQMVVKSVVESVGNGQEFTTTFDYDQGYYDSLEKRFVGFWKISRTEPCVGTVCPRTTVYFDNDYTGSRPSRIDRTDTAGKLWESTVLRYAPKTTLPYDNPMTEKWTFRYASSATTAFRQAYSYTYDAYGRPASVIEYGSGIAPLRMTVNEYTAMNASYFSKVARTALYEGGAIAEAQKRSENRYTYNANGTMATSSVWVSPAPAGTTNPYVTTSYAYDAQSRLVQTTAPLGRVSKLTYETNLGLFASTKTNPANQVETTIWDSKCRKPVSVTAINGTVTAFTYDVFCRETSKTHSSGGFERTTYIPLGTTAQHVLVERPSADRAGNAWVDTYLDGDNRPFQINTKGPRTIAVRKTYDAHGNLASETQPFYEGDPVYSTSYKYDALGRKTQTLFASGKTVTNDYGAISTCTIDEQGHSSCDEIDGLGNRSVHREFVGTRWVATNFLYTARGDVRQIKDALGNVTTYTLDSTGRKVSEVDPVTKTTSTTYTASGQIDRQTNGLGETTVYTYDALDRVRSKTTRSGTANAKTNTYEYDTVQSGYTNIGQLTKSTDSIGSTTFYYDNGGRLVRRVRQFVADGDTPPGAQTVTYVYDAGGRMTRMTSPDGPVAQYSYDAAGRPTLLELALTSPTFQRVVDIDYDAAGQPTRVDYPSAYTTYTYEPTRHFLTAMKTTATAPTVRDLVAYSYVRDGEGRITRVTETTGTTTEQITYGYDTRHQLISAASTLNGTQTWTYDDIGRMIASPFGTNCYDAGTAAYPAPHALRGAGTCAAPTYTYNAIGSLLSGPALPNVSTAGTRTLSYDGDGRLEQVSMLVPGTPSAYVESYKYDAQGARLRSTTYSAPNVVASRTYYAGDAFEYTSKASAGTSYTQYYSLGALNVAKRTRTAAGNRLTFEYADHLGSVVVEGDEAGSVVSSQDYHAFGDERTGTTGASATRHRGYLGEMQDATGLLYLNARYYDPAIGRFVSADPMRAVDTTLGLHPYAYSLNDPINRSDPTGEMSQKEEGGATQSSAEGQSSEGGRFRQSLGRFFDRLGVFIDAVNDRFTIFYPDPSGDDGVIAINLLDNFARGGVTFGKRVSEGGKRIFVLARNEVMDDAVRDIQRLERDATVIHYNSPGRLTPQGSVSDGFAIFEHGFASREEDMFKLGHGWGAIYPTVVHNADEVVFDLRGMTHRPIKKNWQWWQPTQSAGGFTVMGTYTDSELQWLYTTMGQQELGKVFFRNVPSSFPVPMITPPKWRTTVGP